MTRTTLHPILAGTLALAVLLAGCAAKPARTTSPASAPEPTVTNDTGAIGGFVLDLAGLPIEGASVFVRGPGTDLETRSDASGQFAASQLAPGEYQVGAVKLGFAMQQKAVRVNAGDVSRVVLKLGDLAVEGAPYAVLLGPVRGKFFCGWAVGKPGGPCKIIGFADSENPVEQAWSQLSGGENNIFEYRKIIEGNRTLSSDGFGGAVVEVDWKAVSSQSKNLQATVEDLPEEPGARNLSEPVWASAKGQSPLRMTVLPGQLGAGGEAAMPQDAAGFLIGVFPAVDPASPEIPVNETVPGVASINGYRAGASVYTEQPFDVWMTLFYNQAPPAGYTAIPI